MKFLRLLHQTVLILPLAALLLAAPCAHAQPVTVEVSENEKAIFAFHRLGGKEHDFHMIGRSYDEFMDVPTEFKDEVLEQIVLRLKTGFGLYDPARDFLQIKTDILVQLR